MQGKIFNLTAQSTQEVFETTSFMDLIREAPIEGDADIPGIEITATICLGGEISGMIALHCTRSFARTCSALIVGTDTDEFTDEQLCDTVGEIANMIAGTLKRHLSTTIDLFDLALPSMIFSSGHHLTFKGARSTFPRLLIPFVTDNKERFYIEIHYHKR